MLFLIPSNGCMQIRQPNKSLFSRLLFINFCTADNKLHRIMTKRQNNFTNDEPPPVQQINRQRIADDCSKAAAI